MMIPRVLLLAALLSMVNGCSGESSPMWAGENIATPLSSQKLPPPPALAPSLPAPASTPPRLAPRVGSSVPPDLLRNPGEQIRQPTIPPLTSAPSYPSLSPSPLDGPGFQRNGPITYGPGGPYNTVGGTIFGPGGKVCTPVGSSLTCL